LTLLHAYNELMRAEIDYAYFNARRTQPSESTIAPKLIEIQDNGFGMIEPNRPDNIYYNRVVISAEIQTIESALRQIPDEVRAIEVQMPLLTEHTASKLLEAGWVPSSSLCYLSAIPGPIHPEKADIVRLRQNDVALFFDVVGLPENTRKAEYYCNDQFRCYAVFSNDHVPIAWATMYVGECFAFMGNAETAPAFQCRGFHSALLAARMNDAGELNLKVAYTDVLPGTQSHNNCERLGFRLLTVNNIWKRHA